MLISEGRSSMELIMYYEEDLVWTASGNGCTENLIYNKNKPSVFNNSIGFNS
jgi:hypothetical protein